MVATKSSSAPRVVIVGITGNQGGSVAKALIESSQPYRIVGLTRDTSKEAAQALKGVGVEMVGIELAVGNEDEATRVFDKADVVFVRTLKFIREGGALTPLDPQAMTNSMDLHTKDAEVAYGKMLIDAAKTSQVKIFIWSSLPHISKISGGRYTKVFPFDAKAEITEYLQSSNLPHALVPAAGYLQFLTPIRNNDGTYTIYAPVHPETVGILGDTNNDYGKFVRAVLENPALGPGSEVLTGTQVTGLEEVEALTKLTGKEHRFQEVTKEQYFGMMSSFMPAPQVELLYEMYKYIEEFGYYGGKDVVESQKAAGVASPTFFEMIKNQKEGTYGQ